jgi:hypothetical protein
MFDLRQYDRQCFLRRRRTKQRRQGQKKTAQEIVTRHGGELRMERQAVVGYRIPVRATTQTRAGLPEAGAHDFRTRRPTSGAGGQRVCCAQERHSQAGPSMGHEVRPQGRRAMITFQCEHCGRRITAGSRLVNRSIGCPNCLRLTKVVLSDHADRQPFRSDMKTLGSICRAADRSSRGRLEAKSG